MSDAVAVYVFFGVELDGGYAEVFASYPVHTLLSVRQGLGL